MSERGASGDSGSNKRVFDGMASYSYKCIDSSEILHYFPASEVEHGVQCNIVKEKHPKIVGNATAGKKSSLPSMSNAAIAAAVKSITSSPTLSTKVTDFPRHQHNEFAVHNHIVKKLFEDRPGKALKKDVAYLKVSSMGKAFESYDREKNRLVMILPAYFELLRFFKTEYRMVLNRMESDYRSMMEGTDWFSLCPTISFRGPADTVFSTVLDSSNGFDLKLTMTNRLEMGKKNIVLHYTDESMGRLSLPGEVMEVLAKDMTFLEGLSNGEYKESSVAKKSRQY